MEIHSTWSGRLDRLICISPESDGLTRGAVSEVPCRGPSSSDRPPFSRRYVDKLSSRPHSRFVWPFLCRVEVVCLLCPGSERRTCRGQRSNSAPCTRRD